MDFSILKDHDDLIPFISIKYDSDNCPSDLYMNPFISIKYDSDNCPSDLYMRSEFRVDHDHSPSTFSAITGQTTA